tara:strand:- start:875 stop:10201 length:9327 start_codon:yes stop_codon:yes gene_type:complete
MAELRDIVQSMVSSGETEDNIAAVIKRYNALNKPAAQEELPADEEVKGDPSQADVPVEGNVTASSGEESSTESQETETGPIKITPVSTDTTDKEEEEAVKDLFDQYGRYGFTFKEQGMTDNVIIVGPKTDEFPEGEESPAFSIDNWSSKDDSESAASMTAWMQERTKVDHTTNLLANMSDVEVTEDQTAQNAIDDDNILENYHFNVQANKNESEDNEKSQQEELQNYEDNPLRLNELETDKGITGTEDRGKITTEKADSHIKDLTTKAKNSIAIQEVMNEESLSFDEVRENHMDKVEAKVSAMGDGVKTLKELGDLSLEELTEAQEDPNNYEVDDPRVREKVLEYLKEESHARSLSSNVADMLEEFEGGLFTKGGQQKSLEQAAEVELERLSTKDKEFVGKFSMVSSKVTDIDSKLSTFKTRNDKRLAEISKLRNKKYTTQEGVDKANARMTVLREQALADQGSYETLLTQRKQFVASAVLMQKEQGELKSKQEDLDIYFKAIGRNYQAGTVLGVTFANAAIDIGANIEEFAYALNPYVALYDYMDKEDVSPLVKSLITGVSMINPVSGVMAAQAQLGTSGDGVDGDGNETGSYRDQMVSGLYDFQEEMRNSIAEPIPMDEIDSLGDLGMWAATTVAAQLPLLALMYATGGTAIGTIGGRSFTAAEGLIFASSSGGKFRGMKREMDLYDKTSGKDGKGYNWLQLYSTAMLTGAAETLSEKVTLGQMKNMKGAFGNPAARLGFNNFLKKEIWTPENLKYLGKDFLEEGGSEALATISENFLDMTIAGKDVNIWDGVKESFASGVLISGTMKTPALYRAMTAPFRSMDTNQKVGENAARVNKLEKMAQNPDVLPENKAAYEAEIADLVIESNNLIGADIKRVDELSIEDKSSLIKIEKENHFYRQRAERIQADGSLTDAQKASELKRLKDKVDLNSTKKREVIEKYPPKDVEKSYQKRMDWLRGQAQMVADQGGAIINIKEVDSAGLLAEQIDTDPEGAANDIMENDATRAALNQAINDPDTDPADIPELQQMLNDSRVDNKKHRNKLNMFKGNAGAYGAMLPKLDAKGNVLGYDLIVNKETATRDGYFNVAAHEFVHTAFYNTLQKDPAAQEAFGAALIDVFQNDGSVSFTDKGLDIFNRRVSQYTRQEGQGEEVMAIGSELMLDNDIEISEKGLDKVKGIFRRFAQNNFDGVDIKFDTPQDVKNFMIDYHKSVASNKPSKAIAKLTARGAKGKLLDNVKTKKEAARERQFSKAVELNLKADPDLMDTFDAFTKDEDGGPKYTSQADFEASPDFYDAYLEIVEGKKLNGLIQQGMIAEGVPQEAMKEFTLKVKEGIGKRFLPSVNKKTGEVTPGYRVSNDSLFGWLTGVAGGAGKSIIYRAKGDVMVQYTKDAQADITSLDKNIGEGGTLGDILQAEKSSEMEAFENEDLSIGRRDAYVNSPVPVLDQLGLTDAKNKIDSKVDKIQKGKNKVSLDGLTYKGVKSLLVDAAKVDKKGKMKAPTKASDVKPTGVLYSVLDVVAKQIGVDPKRIIANQDLDAKQRKAVKQFLYTKIVNEDGSFNRDILDNVLPEGETRSGEATGIANTKLGLLYDKGERASFADGATAAGKFTQTKRTDVTMEEMLDVVGINPDGSFQSGTASDGALRQMVLSIAQLAGNQSLRENAIKNGTHSEAVVAQLGDGKAEFAWSKEDIRTQPETQDIVSSGWGDLVNEVAAGTLTPKEISTAVDNVYGENVNKSTKNKITKLITSDVSQFIGINKVLKNGFEAITGKETVQYLMERFEGRQIEQGIKNMLKPLIPKGLVIGNLAKDSVSVTKQRAHLIEQARSIIKEFGPIKGLEMVISQLGPSYASMTKIGDGGLTVDTPGGPVVINKDFDKTQTNQNRNQVTTGMPDFIGLINRSGVEVQKIDKTVDKNMKGFTYKAMVDGKWVPLNTSLIPEDSQAFIKNKDFDARKQQAQDARDIVQTMMDNAWKRANNPSDSFDIGDFGLLTMSLGSGMSSPLRRAANAEYIQDGIEDVIRRGIRAGLPMKDIVRYEHMKSKEAVASEIIASYIKSGKLNPSVWDGYQVQVISVEADNLMNRVGYKTLSTLDGSTRLFNEQTLTEVVKNPSMYNLDNISPIRSMDPAKQGTETEIIGDRWLDTAKAFKNNISLDGLKLQKIGRAANKASAYSWSKNPKGISVLDFDDTLATSNSKVISTSTDGTVRELTAEQFAKEGADLLEQGWTHDFSEFNKVVDGKVASLFQKALKLQGKFGNSNMFVLTARPQQSAQSIFDFLKANGLNIPLKNITGLANSTAQAKADWIADKVGEGYNDFYFADDAMQNVKAVKDMLDQFDVKSKVQQAKLQFSKEVKQEFNDILQETTGIESEKQFSDAQAKLRGRDTKYKGIIPASAQDFKGLLYNFISKGKKGDAQLAFLKKALIDPFARGIDGLNTARQNTAIDYKNLLKNFPNVKSSLNDQIEGMDYTYDQAVRTYLWTKAGFEIPGMSQRDANALNSVIMNNSGMQAFAEAVGVMSGKETGLSQPNDYWLAENLTSDLLSDGSIGDARAEHLKEWQDNVDQMFDKDGLNKIESIYGSKFREALEDSLYRMQNGKNRTSGGSRLVNGYMNWVNNSVGAIMFFNMRSAILQTISATNYINWSFNNPAKAAAAFANQPQYWKDFSMIFNSPYLKQRRAGNQRGINEAELSAAVANSDNKAKAAIAWLLKKGFLPTQMADSFAIASGGATFFRNKVKALVKEGMTQEQAEKQAFLDFQESTEVSQQSARPDMISQQQASPLGRLILSFQNTPMQYARIMNKAARDLANGRGDTKTHLSKIAYYGVVQSIIFGALQSALFAAMGEDEEEQFDMKKDRIINGMIDSVLSGIGYGGKAISAVKNTIREYAKQESKGWNADHTYTILQLLGFSPPIGSKLRKIYGSIQNKKFNEGVYEKRGLTLDNPIWSGIGNVIEGITNVPLGRISQKLLNIDNALDDSNKWWERTALLLGWNTWDLGIKDPDIEAVKEEIKTEKKVESKKKQEVKKEEKKKEQEKENETVIEENKKKNDGICAGISKGGKRCKKKVSSGGFCTVHEKVEQKESGVKTQCKKVKDDNKRCGMKTANKSGYCYYHD